MGRFDSDGLVLLSLFSMLGVLLRCGLHVGLFDALVNVVVFADLAANILGCLCMGIFATCPNQQMKACIGTGFAGCLTTFSSWMVDTSITWLSCTGDWTCPFLGTYQLLASWSVCFVAYRAGLSLGKIVWHVKWPGSYAGSTVQFHWTVQSACFVLFVCAVVGCGVSLYFTQHSIPPSLLWAPLGAALRMYLQKWLNHKGIFIANMFGTLLSTLRLQIFFKSSF